MFEFLESTSYFGNTLLIWSYFAFMLFATFIITSLLAHFTIRGLEKAAHKTKNTFDDLIVEIINSPLRLALKALGLYASFYLIELPLGLQNVIHNFLNSLILFALFWTFHSGVELVSYTLVHVKDKFGKKLSNEVVNFISKGIKLFIILLGIMSILQQWGLNVSGFVASLGLGGLAFALAAKDTAANLFGSMVIFIDKPFNVGDWIKTPEVEGTILEIGIRSTKVRTFAQAVVTVPNANLANSAIINWSRMGKRRIKTSLGLTYSTTPDQVSAILADLKSYLSAHKDIDDETIFINFSGFGESTLDIFCYFFTKTTDWGDYMSVKEEVFLEFMKIIRYKHKVSFAFPSQSIYVEKNDLA